MWLHRARAWPVLLVAVLAGCFGGASSPQLADDGTREGHGTLVGVVVDDAIRPLAGAFVNMTGDGIRLNTTTAEDGIFRFPDLVPGTYVVNVAKPFYGSHEQAVVVQANVPDPETVRFQLVFEPEALPYAQVYKMEGFYECGTNPYHVCSNVNIATWIVVCANTEGMVCPGNVTNDRSLMFQWVEPGLDFLQAELTWDPTTPSGEVLSLALGGGSEAELKAGIGSTYNVTSSRSPVMGRISNHEGENSFCGADDTCPKPDTLNQSGIGVERALLVQVAGGPTYPTPLCDVGASPCAAGFAAQQAFTLYTTVFYGYEPPMDWLFTATGKAPDPPGT
jgi:hypothetical protein